MDCSRPPLRRQQLAVARGHAKASGDGGAGRNGVLPERLVLVWGGRIGSDIGLSFDLFYCDSLRAGLLLPVV